MICCLSLLFTFCFWEIFLHEIVKNHNWKRWNQFGDNPRDMPLSCFDECLACQLSILFLYFRNIISGFKEGLTQKNAGTSTNAIGTLPPLTVFFPCREQTYLYLPNDWLATWIQFLLLRDKLDFRWVTFLGKVLYLNKSVNYVWIIKVCYFRLHFSTRFKNYPFVPEIFKCSSGKSFSGYFISC